MLKKLFFMVGIVLVFSFPELVHAEDTDVSNKSEEQIVQETESKQPSTDVEKMSKEKLEIYTHQVDKMSAGEINNELDKYASKTELSDADKEKVEILVKKDKSLEKGPSKFEACYLVFCLVIGLLMLGKSMIPTLDY